MTSIRGGIALAAMLAACTEGPTSTVRRTPITVSATAASNPDNVLSAIVSVRSTHATSVSVRIESGTNGVNGEETPTVAVTGNETIVPVLGLWPDRSYVLRALAHGPDGDLQSTPLTFTTGSLPGDMPRYTAGGDDPTPGYVVFSTGAYGVAIDNSGRVVWYHRFEGSVLNFQPEATGRYAAGAPSTNPGAAFEEIDPLGTITRSLGCTGGMATRFHDVEAEADGSYWLMCDETRTMDLRAVGGVAAARVTATLVQHVSATGAQLFQWNAFDHFAIGEIDRDALAGSAINWTHGNALDFDTDGNLLVSFRNLSELTKIDSRTGAVLWRLGGSRSDFTFGSTPQVFARQHGLRSAGAGSFTILDNLGVVGTSRAEHYTFDEGTHSVRLTRLYVPSQPVVAQLGGTTQQLPGGRLLVAYGSGGRVEEYDLAGRMVWEIHGNAGYVFRATRVASLYDPVPY